MKRIIGISLVGLVIASALTFTSCKVDPSQITTIAQQAGLFGAVGWIAYDNPDPKAIAAVKSVLGIIVDKSYDVQNGKTYSEVILPDLIKFIDSSVDAQYKPIAKAGAVSLLGAIDMLFVVHPEWKANQSTAASVVTAFINGANSGLSLSEKSPVIIQARSSAATRSRIFHE